MSSSSAETVRQLLEDRGRTYADEAGITLRDTPSPLFQLLTLSLLASARIAAGIAAASARELWSAGWRTPQRMVDSTWQERVDALGRGGYRRYDESTATRLGDLADRVIEEYGGDLRRLRAQSGGDIEQVRDAVTAFTGIGLTGADIFCREVQVVWPEIAPFFDDRSLRGARRLGLPDDPERLASLAPGGRVAELAAALVRVA